MDRLRATTAHQISDRPPIQVRPGDEVSVGERDDEWPAFALVTASSWQRLGTGSAPVGGQRAGDGPRGYDTTELPTAAGDVLSVVERDVEGEWTWCRAADGREGWVPDKKLAPA